MEKKIPNEKLGRAGEYSVAGELLKRGYDVDVTVANAKAVDIRIYNHINKTYRTVEVKTTIITEKHPHIITRFFQNYSSTSTITPDYWVLVFIDKDLISHYYVLTHQEVGDLQVKMNNMTCWPTEKCKNGVDNIYLDQLTDFENRWDIIPF